MLILYPPLYVPKPHLSQVVALLLATPNESPPSQDNEKVATKEKDLIEVKSPYFKPEGANVLRYSFFSTSISNFAAGKVGMNSLIHRQKRGHRFPIRGCFFLLSQGTLDLEEKHTLDLHAVHIGHHSSRLCE